MSIRLGDEAPNFNADMGSRHCVLMPPDVPCQAFALPVNTFNGGRCDITVTFKTRPPFRVSLQSHGFRGVCGDCDAPFTDCNVRLEKWPGP